MSTNGVQLENITGNVTIQQARGDIVAGNKTVIQNIIQQAAQKIITAPYKFLASYDISDRDIFFGRTTVIEELVGKIPRYKTLVINGRSGSGKTSLINAGLIPRLADNGYHYLSFREYSDPLRQLREHVAQDDLFKPYADQTHSLPQFLKTVTRQQKMHLVVIFDQFERFFVNVPAAVRTQFIQEIKACLDSDLSGEELDLVFALREDFFGAFVIEFETLMPTFFNDTDRFNLLPLRRDEAREAILRPLKHIPVHIGYSLQFVDEILLPGLMGESAGGAQIDPPHLQIVCNQLYQAVRERYAADLEQGGMAQIDRVLYETLGETRGILRTYLDDFIDRTAHRDSGGRDVLRSMLKLMMETTGTRKFISFADLKHGLPDVQPDAIEQHLREFQDGRIIETRGQGEAAQYSLSHEVMVAKVQSWFDEREMQRKNAQETLERGLAEWQSSQTLLNKKQVKHIRKWLAESLDEEAELFLKQSERKLFTRRLWLSIGAGAIYAGLFMLVFFLIPSLFYQFERADDSNAIVIKRGYPGLNLRFLGFPKSIEQDAATGYTLDQIADIRGLFSTSFRKKKQRTYEMIPFLKLSLQGLAYEKFDELDRAIRAAVRTIDELSGSQYEPDKEQAALLLIRHLDRIQDDGIRQKAVATLAVVGRGDALNALKSLASSAHPAIANTAQEAQHRIEERITNKMVRIRAGEFVMGIQEADLKPLATEYNVPERAIIGEIHPDKGRIDHDFMIDVYEVTNAEYVTFLNVLGRHQNEQGTLLIKTHDQDQASRIRKEQHLYLIDGQYARHPVVTVSWYGAQAFCTWLGKRLPTEAEWERAARGEQGNLFPWGDTFDARYVNIRKYWEEYWNQQSVPTDQRRPATLEVGTLKENASPEEVYDMAGNVWEWTDSLVIRYTGNSSGANDSLRQYYDNPDYRVARGGSYDEPSTATARATTRLAKERNATDDDVGFRCVFDVSGK
jgi:formylglycine-generating enzyme required for sulfatase activity